MFFARQRLEMFFYMGSPSKDCDFLFDSPINPTRPGVGFIAAGSGIAPIFQRLLKLEDQRKANIPTHKISLIYSNKTFFDILLFNELERFATQHSDWFAVHYTITRENNHPSPEERKLGTRLTFGRVNAAIIQERMPREKNFHVLVCGPGGMWEDCLGWLIKDGYERSECTELEA